MTARRGLAGAANALRQLRYLLTAGLALSVIWLLRKLPADKALDFAAWLARKIGPLTGRHKIALDNLRRAYPELPEPEIRRIASENWGHMARLSAEYIFLDKLFDYVPGAETPGRIEVVNKEIFIKVRAEQRPHLFFTGHLGNFELLPVAAATFDLFITAMFRAPNNPYLARYIMSSRAGAMGDMLASGVGAAFTLAGILERGGNVGVLVDQKFTGGVETTFFGRECLTSPLAAKLARQFECDVYPAHSVRLPGNRFRLTIHDRLELPRDAGGAVDVAATCQLLNDVVEGWVRETPEQWMWFHRRWEIKHRRRGRKPV